MSGSISRLSGTISIDLETRSSLELKKCGTYRYAMDPSTDVWCAAWCLGEQEIQVWEAGEPVPEAIVLHAEKGGTFSAWNAQFERLIWKHVLVPRYGWPGLKTDQWRCTQAEAMAYGLPASLEDAARSLGLDVQKDSKGKNLMLRMSRPRSEDTFGFVWWDDLERVERLKEYCRQDVKVERSIAGKIPRLSEQERKVWLLDQRINDRGICLDRRLAEASLAVVEQARASANEKMQQITCGSVVSVTNAPALTEWLYQRGIECDGVAKESVSQLLEEKLPPDVEGALKLRAENSLSSIAKLTAMLEACCPDGRIRGLLKYHGASTGRWSGKLVQPQNFPRGMPYLDIEQAIRTIIQQNAQLVDILHGPPVEVVSGLLRSMLVSAKGKVLVAADYSSIEARVLAWLAGEKRLLTSFSNGYDVYRLMASSIYGIEEAQVTRRQRQVGKMAVLGCGYAMGPERFREQCAQAGILIDEEQACFIVKSYRKSNPCISGLWKKMEAAAIKTVQSRIAQTSGGGRISFEMKDQVLRMILPSGRAIHYHKPKIISVETPWNELAPALIYHGINTVTRKWTEQRTYGGKLVENAVQAIARDILAEAQMRMESEGWNIILSVHDELIAECDEDHADLEEFASLMASVPEWATGCPIEAEGWISTRYRK